MSDKIGIIFNLIKDLQQRVTALEFELHELWEDYYTERSLKGNENKM